MRVSIENINQPLPMAITEGLVTEVAVPSNTPLDWLLFLLHTEFIGKIGNGQLLYRISEEGNYTIVHIDGISSSCGSLDY